MVATEEHCFYCFDTLVSTLQKTEIPEPEFKDAEYPLFVTWNIETHTGKHLRGCIGNFNAMPLKEGLKHYALTSAFQDRRFSPITSREVPRLSCGVSLLTDFEEGEDYLDWEIGKHGIWIEFINDHGHRRTATYLPEVMVEQGWSKLEAIHSLLRKGGFRGKITEQVCRSIKLTRYQSSKCEVSYQEYLDYVAQRNT